MTCKAHRIGRSRRVWRARRKRAATPSAWRARPRSTRSTASSRTRSINTSGLAVGLPDGQMGNSEVGHMNMGSGRIVYQELTRINKSISDGDFFDEPARSSTPSTRRRRAARRCTCMGLTSPGGVHSSLEHAYALVELAKRRGLDEGLLARVPRRARHAAEERRQLPARRSSASLAQIGVGRIATVGRALLGHGPRQPLGSRASRRTTC